MACPRASTIRLATLSKASGLKTRGFQVVLMGVAMDEAVMDNLLCPAFEESLAA